MGLLTCCRFVVLLFVAIVAAYVKSFILCILCIYNIDRRPKTWMRSECRAVPSALLAIPEGGQGGSPFFPIKEASQKLSISVTR
eukprot:scaffold16262_cov79-Skeletonema_dohrnii-CCMP3373.AAC.1